MMTVCLMSCSDNDNLLENGILTGEFKEFSPIEGASTIQTTPDNLTYITFGKTIPVSFSVKVLSGNRLELSCNECDETEPIVVPYKIVNDDTFEIGTFIRGANQQIFTYKRI